MGALSGVLFALQVLPGLILGAQQLHAGQKGETKKQQVLDWLGFGTVAATQIVVPGLTGANSTQTQQAQQVGQAVTGVATEVSSLIDNIVAIFHHNNLPGFGVNKVPTVEQKQVTVSGGKAVVTTTDNPV